MATGWQGLILPSVALGFSAAAIIARLVRSSLVDVLVRDYVRTARAKGLRERVVILRHALKNALIPVVTVLGLQFGTLLGGAVVVETVFARPGIGQLVVKAILEKDFPIVQGVVLVHGDGVRGGQLPGGRLVLVAGPADQVRRCPELT